MESPLNAALKKRSLVGLLRKIVSGACVLCFCAACLQWPSAARAEGTESVQGGEDSRMNDKAYQIAEAERPEGFVPPFSEEEADEEAWWDAMEAKDQAVIPNPERVRRFAWRTAAALAEKGEGENLLCSPMNLWFCAGMTAHLTAGESRRQILAFMDETSDQDLDEQILQIYRSLYRYDLDAACVPGASLWLNSGVQIKKEALDRIVSSDHADVFQGPMGEENYDLALRTWLSRQTKGLLDRATGDLRFSPVSDLSVCTALYYKARWVNPFREEATSPEVFHGAEDTETLFMHRDAAGYIYRGERFTAVREDLFDDGHALFILPNSDTAPEDLLKDEETLRFLEADRDWENSAYAMIHMSMPRIDCVSSLTVSDMMKQMGVTDVFDAAKADFSEALFSDHPVSFSGIQQFCRFTADEQGIEAAAVTAADVFGMMIIEEDVEFRLDRPFLYVLSTQRNLPLFVGVYRSP